MILDHFVLNVSNMDMMIDFYRYILSFKIERYEEYKAGTAPFPIARGSTNFIIDLFPIEMWHGENYDNANKKVNMNHYCLALDKKEWELLQQKLEMRAIQIEEGPVNRAGAQGIGNAIYFRDPDQNLIEARYYE